VPDLGALPDLSKVRDLGQGHRIGEATPQYPDKTIIERVVVVLKPDGVLTRQDLQMIEQFAHHAAVQAERIPLVGTTKFDP
jgi:hypothetical protein